MLTEAQVAAFTPFGVTKSGQCRACRNAAADICVFPTTDISFVMCDECVRGAVMAVAREHKRRNDRQRPPPRSA